MRFVYIIMMMAMVFREEVLGNNPSKSDGSPMIKTNIALVGADASNTNIRTRNDVKIDPKSLVDEANKVNDDESDIEEDENDRFITTAKGKMRPEYEHSKNEEEWNDEPMSVGKLLKRVKRCNNDDDNSNRARRARRARKNKIKKQRMLKRRAQGNASRTTTITRKVIENDKVVSQTVETLQSGQHSANGLPTIITSQQPTVVHTVVEQPTFARQLDRTELPQHIVISQQAHQ